MSEKMTPERVLRMLLMCGQKEEMKAVRALITERDRLRDGQNEAIEMYNGIKAKLAAAEERMTAMEGALREIRQAIFDAGDDPVARIGAFDQITAALDGTTTSQKGEDHDQEV